MGACKVKIFLAAQRDLEQAIDYLNTLSPQAAIRYYDLLGFEIAVFPKCRNAVPAPRIWPWRPKGIDT